MTTRRQNAVCGFFYPGTSRDCSFKLEKYTNVQAPYMRDTPRAGIVPHAGWDYSGPTAGKVFAAIKKYSAPETFIFFSASHGYAGAKAAIMSEGIWVTPLGDVEVDTELAGTLLEKAPGLTDSAGAHEGEHAIEVQIPFVRHLFPGAKIVPIIVPATEGAAPLGAAIGAVIAGMKKTAVIGSADLTHYGPRYGFMPKGTGQAALDWVKKVNDKRIIDMALQMRAEEVVAEAHNYHNSCGSGAIAATVAAARACGKKSGALIDYTTSYDVSPTGKPSDFVGYAGIVF